MRVTFDAEPEADPLLLQPDLFGGPGQVVGEQGWLFDCGRAEPCRHPPTRQYAWHAADGVLCVGCCACGKVLRGAAPRADQPEMFQ